MTVRLFITLTIVLFYANFAQAKLDIVYPTQKDITVNSDCTFFSGNTDNNAKITINSKPVKLWENNFFVHVVPLEYGKNKIKIKSQKNGKTEELTYTIKRNKPSKWGSKKEIEYKKVEDGLLYSKITKENATIRSSSTIKSNRIGDYQEGIVLYLEGKKGDYYKINEKGNSEYWIHKNNITEPSEVGMKILAKLRGTKQYSDANYDYQKFYLSRPIMYTIDRQGNKLKLTLHGIEDKENDNFEYTFEFDSEILGYECYYEENNLIFKKAKLPEINHDNILKDINIFIDAGHGGKEKGTVGPSRIREKDVNLDIANKLIKLLKEDGANVSYSRNSDIHVELYDRVKLAKENNALISLSIHSNSLPYGKNPYIQHGTETHYYNENSKLLAEIITKNLANDLNIKNNGTKRSSFALTRSTNPVSVLVEVAYMINPEEYILLKDENIRTNVAKSIKNSIKEYVLYLSNKRNMI